MNKKVITLKSSDLSVRVIAREAMIISNHGKEPCCIKSYLSDSPAMVKELERDISTDQGLADLAEYLNKDQDSDYFYRIVQ
jgi:hypothetical protein